jgi:hypothetical protein
MTDEKVLAAMFVAIVAMGFRMEWEPATVSLARDPVQVLVQRKQLDQRIAEHAKESAAHAAGAHGGGGQGADGKDGRNVGGDLDKSTDDALHDIEEQKKEVQRALKALPIAGGSGDDDDDDDDADKGGHEK